MLELLAPTAGIPVQEPPFGSTDTKLVLPAPEAPADSAGIVGFTVTLFTAALPVLL